MIVPTTALALAVVGALASQASAVTGPSESGLDPAVIQRIVQARYPAIRECYKDGLKKNPDLRGTLTTRFVIGRDGSVVSASEAPSPRFPDAKVAECVVAEFAALRFPKPDTAPVPVVYPIVFAPDD